MSEVKKVVLAYSDGLDTSIIIPWLKEHYNNCEVIAVCGNVGQKGELEGLEERAKASGASKLYIEDLTDEFVEDYVIPTMQAGADYEGYLLGTSFARPILAKRVVEIARAEGADAVCHGSTGKGNDQVRFELAITFGELVYDGQWFSPLRKALSAFVTSHRSMSPARCVWNCTRATSSMQGSGRRSLCIVKTSPPLPQAATTSRAMPPVSSASMVCPPRCRLS